MRLMTQAAAAAVLLGLAISPAAAQTPQMSFFVTSVGLGDGGNLGGIEGADAHCQSLAEAAGAGDRTWVAYLSTQGEGAVNARDRIGSGPWYNAAGTLIAEDVDGLHAEDVAIDHETALDETGAPVPFVDVDAQGNPVQPADRTGPPVEHDILTGTQLDGTAFPEGDDRTCGNWTSNSEGSAMLGHHDRRSLQPGISPWNAAHPSRSCSQADLVATGGSGRLYCFASDASAQ